MGTCFSDESGNKTNPQDAELAEEDDVVATRQGGGGHAKSTLQQQLRDGVKVVILGEMSTGKTSVVLRLVRDEFTDAHEPTIGAAFMVHKMNVDGIPCKMEIWDTAGQDRYKTLAPMYYNGAPAAIVVYDITNPESFTTMQRWVQELREKGESNLVIALAGNKVDLEHARRIPKEQTMAYIQQIVEGGGEAPLFVECSAKTGQGIQDLFSQLLHKLVERSQQGQ